MANRSKAKGTAWETTIVRWLIDNGYPDAKRNTLGGRFDPGDIEPVPAGSPPIIISAKTGYGGAACPSCKHVREVHQHTQKWEEWWTELTNTRKRRNPTALALLCLHRAGKGSPESAHWYVDHTQTLGRMISGVLATEYFRHRRYPNLGPVKITGLQALTLMGEFAAPLSATRSHP